MTPEIIRRRVGTLEGVTHVVLPGRCKGDLEALAAAPRRAGAARAGGARRPAAASSAAKAKRRDLARHDCRIFAEIVEASALGVAEILGPGRGPARRRAPT